MAVDEVLPDSFAGERIDRVVSLLTGCSRAEAASLVADGRVRLDDQAMSSRSARVSAGDVIHIDWAPAVAVAMQPDADVELTIVHVDDDVIVVDKQPGLVVHPGSGQSEHTLVHGLLARFPEIATVGEPERPGIVHRLDKETSGLLVVARNDEAHRSLSAQLKDRTASRRYRTLVWGHLDAPRGLIDAPIGRSARTPTKMAVSAKGRDARTAYEVEAAFDEPAAVSLLHCHLETGRTHQIRVHLAAIGHAVVGDARYGGKRQPFEALPRFFLHAEELSFVHPATGEQATFTSELPADLAAVLAGLGATPDRT